MRHHWNHHNRCLIVGTLAHEEHQCENAKYFHYRLGHTIKEAENVVAKISKVPNAILLIMKCLWKSFFGTVFAREYMFQEENI